MAKFMDRIRNGWNAFAEEEKRQLEPQLDFDLGASYSSRPTLTRRFVTNDRSIVDALCTTIAIDAAAVDIKHARVDDNGQYIETILSGLNSCLTLEANIDQEARSFKQDIYMTLLQEGTAAIVPIDTSVEPLPSGGFNILSLRVGKIVEWYPRKVKVLLYDDRDGTRKEIVVNKETTAIVENPLYSVMNEPNSTLQRLIRKLSLLDSVDEQTSSGKLDLIVQLPYVIKSDARRLEAEKRRSDLEAQLKGSKYGIAYTDGTERITQLNRPAENNLLAQIKELTEQLYSQLGTPKEVFNGTADEAAMRNYQVRTIKPLLDSVSNAMCRTFISKTARTQHQTLKYFLDPFEFMPMSEFGDLSDKLSRNEIATANELRGAIGWRPSTNPKADELRNSNMPQPEPPGL